MKRNNNKLRSRDKISKLLNILLYADVLTLIQKTWEKITNIIIQTKHNPLHNSPVKDQGRLHDFYFSWEIVYNASHHH